MLKTNYKNGLIDGEWIKYDFDGIVPLEIGQMVKGNRDGKWEYYFMLDRPAAVEYYDNGKRIGDWIAYHVNGRKASEISYKDDKPIGTSYNYYEDGKIESISHYRLGLVDSIYVQYHPNNIKILHFLK